MVNGVQIKSDEPGVVLIHRHTFQNLSYERSTVITSQGNRPYLCSSDGGGCLYGRGINTRGDEPDSSSSAKRCLHREGVVVVML